MTSQHGNVALIGQSLAMKKLRSLIQSVAPTRLPVLVEGDTGTGKELVAATLHQLSGRKGPLVPFNVCAIGESIFEDALFGHVRGAFTGAHMDSLGFLREANGGTAFFDEISALPLALQAKLLRAIETGVFRPIGATRDASSDFRVVAATNEKLVDAAARGTFRADLRHRLSGVVVAVPPLSQRAEDIPELATHFLRQSVLSGVGDVRIDESALRLLMALPWTGNVRELKLVVETAGAFARGCVDLEAVQSALSHRPGSGDEKVVSHEQNGRQELIVALHDASWDVVRTAEGLGVHPVTLYRRMKRYGIQAPRFAVARSG